jgi:hypothetical protein
LTQYFHTEKFNRDDNNLSIFEQFSIVLAKLTFTRSFCVVGIIFFASVNLANGHSCETRSTRKNKLKAYNIVKRVDSHLTNSTSPFLRHTSFLIQLSLEHAVEYCTDQWGNCCQRIALLLCFSSSPRAELLSCHCTSVNTHCFW